ncbi:asparagine synthase (glutamine-hydrolyzing) [Solidesulfovibrio carbinolicus]|uniref:asparagine synthase (glutamine-hydrolyzing) n=1 Tax=Solidesulfovibrio carbinolicus TaxID=296842 RepID=UPI0013EBF08D|nr:asparagine synthase (glutamine-hydrolyzing) [Solidesulfovibrio carbinolicus]
MCGIAGILCNTPGRLGGELGRMTRAMRHRGPDGQGHVALRPGRRRLAPATAGLPDEEAEVFLGHRRLAIIDLQGTAQPLCNENGAVWTVFNGEIYNYRELRRELASQGHVLREKGDTEVLVHLWERLGEALPAALNGMFALAVYDVDRDTLFLARDRFGEKPLYYWESRDGFAFASELAALALLEGFPRDALDEAAASRFFATGYVPHPDTIYAAARCLPPGHVLVRRGGRTVVKPYWRPDVRGDVDACDLDALEDALDEAVRSRLEADVPVGCFLSAGLDSSLIAASMAKRGKPLTFTIASGHWDGDESPTARRIAAHLGTEHHEFRVEPDFVAVAEKLAWHYGQPFADYSAVPTYYVSRETRRRVKVALSGDGGDELFAGYERYGNAWAASLCGLLPEPGRSLAAALAGRFPGGDFGTHLADFLRVAGPIPVRLETPSTFYHPYWRERCFTPAFLSGGGTAPGPGPARYAAAAGQDARSRFLETDQALYLPADILTKVDIASMSVSLETRAPFLDHRLVEMVNRMAFGRKRQGAVGKLPLRALAARRLPPDVAGLPKRGFTLPLAGWMRRELRDWSHAALFDAPEAWEAFLCPQAVSRLWEEHQSGWADHALRLWSVIAWGLWRRTVGQEAA